MKKGCCGEREDAEGRIGLTTKRDEHPVKDREIRQQNKLLSQLEARLAAYPGESENKAG